MAAKEKQLTRMEVDGSVVEVKAIPLEVEYTYSDGSPSYRQRSLYEVYVDGVKRGYVGFPKGYGGHWWALALRPKHAYSPSYHTQDAEEKARFGLGGYYRALSPGALNEPENWGEHERSWADRNAILRAFPKMVALGRCPSPAEEVINHEADKVAYAERIAKDAADKVRWAEEAAERDRQKQIAAQKAEEERVETEAGLESIRERLFGQLTNFEIAALERALQQWRKK